MLSCCMVGSAPRRNSAAPDGYGLCDPSPSRPAPFAPRFFHTTPRNGALAFRWTTPSIRLVGGLSPPSCRTWAILRNTSRCQLHLSRSPDLPGHNALTVTLMPVESRSQRSLQELVLTNIGLLTPLRRLYPLLPVRRASALPTVSFRFRSRRTPLPFS